MTNYLNLNSQIITKKDGFYQLDKDAQALELYLKEIDSNTLKFSDVNERLEYLINNNFYDNFYLSYTKKEISEIDALINAAGFKFASFMSASKFYKDYALKSDDKKTYLETYQDRVLAIVLYLAGGNIKFAKDLATSLVKQYYQPATPTFLNAGKKRRGELVSCFLLEMEDSLNSITFNLSTAMYLSKIGGGVAINLSKLRARGENIKGIVNVAKGVVPVLKLLEDGFNYADQMGQRKGAGAGYLNIFHADIEDFLDTKKINADEKSRIQSLSLGITVSDKFIDIARNNEDFYVFYPSSVYKVFGIHLDEMDMQAMYDKLVAHSDVRKKKLDARDLLAKIAKTQFESGYPYLIYIDTANREHPLKNIGKIKMSNLCTEIFQLQKTSEINDYNEADNIGEDVSCVLGSLNIVNVMESGSIAFAVKTAVLALSSVSDLSSVSNAPSIAKANNSYHSIGLGAMNLHGYFAKNAIPYESDEAKDFVSAFFMAMNYYSIKTSMEIAKERGITFKDFALSEYANGNYFKKYLENNYSPKTEKISNLFHNITLPTNDDWKNLMNDVQKYGLYNAYRLAIAPTQSISYLQNSTPSVLPVVDTIETRTYANSTTYYPMPYLNRENIFLYKSAYNMDNYKLIDLMSLIQEHVDQGISTILYTTNQASTTDLVRLYLYAHKKGLKSLYYTRTKNLSVEECLSCSV